MSESPDMAVVPVPVQAPAAAVPHHSDARVLIVDDEPANVRLLARMLHAASYDHVFTTTQPHEALTMFALHPADIILLDLHMPELDGLQLMQRVHELVEPGEFLPVLMLTGDMSPDVRRRALAAGAMDFVTKPFEVGEVLLRIRNLLHTRFLHRELKQKNEQLEVRVRHRTAELEQARLDILERLARAAEFRDDATGEHTRRVGHVAEQIATELGIDVDEASMIGRAAMLHDIGKIGIPDSILLKPHPLTAEEFEVIKQHTEIGREILAGSTAPLLRVAELIAHTHHERWDGRGYHGMAGDAIPLEGRIVSVADTFDALVNDRPYRSARSVADALEEMRRERGAQFDPAVLDAFLRLAGRAGVLHPGGAA
jgi:putative two-component system response regulator